MNGSLRLFHRIFSAYKIPLAAYGVLGVLHGLLLIPIPLLLKYLIDQSSAGAFQGMAPIVGIMLGACLMSIALLIVGRIGLVKTVKKRVEELRIDLARQIIHTPHRGQWKEYEGQLKSIVVDDTERLDMAITIGFGQVLPACISAIIMSIVLLSISPLLFVIACAMIPPIFLTLIRFKHKLQDAHQAFRDSFSSMEHSVQFLIHAWELIKTHTAERIETEKQKRTFAHARQSSQKLATLHIALQALQESIGLIFGILLLAIGFYFVSMGKLAAGEVVSFFAGFSLLRVQLSNIFNGWPHIVTLTQSLQHINQLLAIRLATPYQGTKKHALQGEISLQNISVTASGTHILRNVSVTFRPHSFSVITGKNGDGKTTLLLVLLGLVSPNGGRILIDQEDLTTLDIHHYRKQLAVVSQHPLFLNATAQENKGYGLDDGAAAHDLIGEEFHIEENRHVDSLSGGEKQKLMIERALMRNPKVLLLDEPTNHLDAQSFERLLDFVKTASRTRTIICISHEPRIIAQADYHVHLQKGALTDAV